MSEHEWDVVVVGGGAAGLAAADALVRTGQRVLLCEARDRLGGRVWTDRTIAAAPIEWGAEFVHGGRVSTWELIDDRADEVVRSRTLYRRRGAWSPEPVWQDDPRYLDADAPEPGPHETAADYLDRLGFTAAHLPPGAWTLLVDSEGPQRWSARAMRDQGWFGPADAGDPGDHVVVSGYDRILARLAPATEVRLGVRVREVARHDDGVTVSADSGDGIATVHAAAAVVAVPLAVLQAGDLDFVPGLPSEVQAAVDALGTGDVAKLLYLLPRRVLPPGATVVLDVDADPPCFWRSGRAGDPDGELVVAWASGDGARRLLTAGREEALAAGLATLRELVGAADLVPLWSGLHDWSADPLSRGGYSFVPPGGHAAQRVLAEPIDARLAIAGEATAVGRAMTVDGAIDSGRRAAGQVLAAPLPCRDGS